MTDTHDEAHPRHELEMASRGGDTLAAEAHFFAAVHDGRWPVDPPVVVDDTARAEAAEMDREGDVIQKWADFDRQVKGLVPRGGEHARG